MPKLVCVKCNTEMYPKKNGVWCLDYFNNNGDRKPYQLWQVDKWACGKCGFEILSGFSNSPIWEHYQGTIPNVKEEIIANYGRVYP